MVSRLMIWPPAATNLHSNYGLLVEAGGLPVADELLLEFGEFFDRFAGQHEAAGGIEAVFITGGLGTEHAFGRLRAAGFRAVDPGGFGAVRFCVVI